MSLLVVALVALAVQGRCFLSERQALTEDTGMAEAGWTIMDCHLSDVSGKYVGNEQVQWDLVRV